MKQYIRYIVVILIFGPVFTSVSAQLCPGEEGVLRFKMWRNISQRLTQGEMHEFHSYPNSPDVVIPIFKMQTPRYDNYYGSMVEGFLKVEESDSIQFNITGDDYAYFYLSTDMTRENATLICETTGHTGSNDHNKYPEQTSMTYFLEKDSYYYFRIELIERGGADFANIFWNIKSQESNDWMVIPNKAFFDIECETICPDIGTPCDDNNSNTIEDQEDGYCNCVGQPKTTNPCIGNRNEVETYEYSDINGNNLENLYNHVNYPASPNFSFKSPFLGELYNRKENVGTLTQGYLTVPVSGNYIFNVTGDNQTKFFLSSDETPENLESLSIEVPHYCGSDEYTKYPEQTSGEVYLEANTYYYYELHHKQGGYSNFAKVSWKSPFLPDQWKRISSFYLYDFACEIACIPEGTVCDDGNPWTNDDQYDTNCNCVGTPCSGPDCDDPLAYYVPIEKCGETAGLDNTDNNTWRSCVKKESPNSIRGEGHWLQLDLGVRYQLLQSHIWNYNVANETNLGMTSVVIDFSEDGINWTELGTYTWDQADGTSQYAGFEGPNFDGVYARYILITSLDTDSVCQGLGKVSITAVKCPLVNTLCDDENALTIHDAYDANCYCLGTSVEENQCTHEIWVLGDTLLQSEVFGAMKTVYSISTIDETAVVGMLGGEFVELGPGFETRSGATFLAAIESCETQMTPQSLAQQTKNARTLPSVIETLELEIFKEEETDFYIAQFAVPKPGEIKLWIKDTAGNAERVLLTKHTYKNKGFYQKRFRTKKLMGTSFDVVLQQGKDFVQKPIE